MPSLGKKIKAKAEQVKSKKRKAEALTEQDAPEKDEEPEETGRKEKKFLSAKKQKRKDITLLYSELISPGRERKTEVIVEEILDLLSQRAGASPYAQYCASEIGSKVLQACLKWGNKEQRRKVLTQLKPHLTKLARERYGNVVVTKLLTYNARTASARKPTDAEKKMQTQNIRDFLEPFHGKALNRVFFHKHGCRVVNAIYFSEHASTKEKRLLLHGIAIPATVSLLRPELPGNASTLRHLLKDDEAKGGFSDQHRNTVMEHLAEVVDKCVEKELLSIEIVHVLLQAYCERTTESKLRDLAEKGMAGAPYLLSSKPGAEAVMYMLGVANAKQRKAFCKELKGKFVAMATNAVDYTVMMRMVATIDDTVMLEKTALAEWQGDLETLVFDKYGQKVLAWMFKPDDSKFFSPYERQCLSLSAPSSIKAPEKRYQELLRNLRPPVGAKLKQDPLKVASDAHAKDLLVAYLSADWDAQVVNSLIESAEKEAQSGADEFGRLGNGTVVTTLTALLKLESAAKKTPPLAEPLWSRCFKPHLKAAVLSPCSRLLLTMMKQGDSTGNAIKSFLQKNKISLKEAVKVANGDGKKTTAAQHLLDAL